MARHTNAGSHHGTGCLGTMCSYIIEEVVTMRTLSLDWNCVIIVITTIVIVIVIVVFCFVFVFDSITIVIMCP